MMTLFVLPLILAFAPIAVWALRVGGMRRLLLLCALTLLAVLFLALLLSAVYSVPSPWRVVLYFLVFVGPSILLATGFLALSRGFARTFPLQLIAAFAGSVIGLAGGGCCGDLRVRRVVTSARYNSRIVGRRGGS